MCTKQNISVHLNFSWRQQETNVIQWCSRHIYNMHMKNQNRHMSALLISWSNHKIFFHFLQKNPTPKTPASHQQLHIFLLPVQASTLALSFEPAHTSSPLQTKKNPSACTKHITRKSVRAWQVIAPNGCQPAEMWGGHCEKRSETRGERPSLVLALSPSVSFGSEPDLTSKSSQDMNSLWRAHPVKVDAMQTCTMPKIYAHKKENHRN